jgi:hypothetical protein
MRSLKRFLANLFRGGQRNHKEPVDLRPEDVTSESLLARSVFSRKHYWKDPLRPKPAVYFDAPYNQNAARFEVSTFCADQLSDQQAQSLLTRYAGNRANSIKAIAHVKVGALPECPLSHDPNWTPPRHVDVVGWDGSREARLSQAQRLAANCARFVEITTS